MKIQLIDVSAVLGLCAMVTLTVNVLLGMLLSCAYKTFDLWKKMPPQVKKLNILQLHNWTAYLALTLVVLHPLFLLLDKQSHFYIRDVFFPLGAPKQNYIVMLGSLSALALIIVMITTQKAVKRHMSFRVWKNIHMISYFTALLFIVHGLLMDPLLKDRTPDWFDGEKLLCELCGLILIAASYMRYKYHRGHQLKKAGTE